MTSRSRSWLGHFALRFGAATLAFTLGYYLLIGSGYGCHDATHSVAVGITSALQSAAESHDHCDDKAPSSGGTHDSKTCASMLVCGALVMTAQMLDGQELALGSHSAPRFALASALTRSVAPDVPPPRV